MTTAFYSPRKLLQANIGTPLKPPLDTQSWESFTKSTPMSSHKAFRSFASASLSAAATDATGVKPSSAAAGGSGFDPKHDLKHDEVYKDFYMDSHPRAQAALASAYGSDKLHEDKGKADGKGKGEGEASMGGVVEDSSFGNGTHAGPPAQQRHEGAEQSTAQLLPPFSEDEKRLNDMLSLALQKQFDFPDLSPVALSPLATDPLAQVHNSLSESLKQLEFQCKYHEQHRKPRPTHSQNAQKQVDDRETTNLAPASPFTTPTKPHALPSAASQTAPSLTMASPALARPHHSTTATTSAVAGNLAGPWRIQTSLAPLKGTSSPLVSGSLLSAKHSKSAKKDAGTQGKSPSASLNSSFSQQDGSDQEEEEEEFADQRSASQRATPNEVAAKREQWVKQLDSMGSKILDIKSTVEEQSHVIQGLKTENDDLRKRNDMLEKMMKEKAAPAPRSEPVDARHVCPPAQRAPFKPSLAWFAVLVLFLYCWAVLRFSSPDSDVQYHVLPPISNIVEFIFRR